MHNSENLLEVRNLTKHFPIKKGVFRRVVGHVKAVDDISFDIKRGKTLGLVGESGCGKTTAGRTILKLHEPTAGEVIFKEHSVFELPKSELKAMRTRMQIIFQDPYSSLNPRLPVFELVGEALREHKIVRNSREMQEKVIEIILRFNQRASHALSASVFGRAAAEDWHCKGSCV
jgi:ABC-type oligopeptide transport system ATPase subunit